MMKITTPSSDNAPLYYAKNLTPPSSTCSSPPCTVNVDLIHLILVCYELENEKMSKKHRLKSMSMDEFKMRYIRPDIPTRCTWKLNNDENNKADPHHHIEFNA